MTKLLKTVTMDIDMASSFSAQEKLLIREKLYEAAKQYAAIVGIRKTTVEQLAEAADISKGMFYKLYPFKEMLFLEMLEDMHSSAFKKADSILKTFDSESDYIRMKRAICSACQVMDSSGMMEIIENDTSYLLRKLPEDIASTHYHDISVHIKDLLKDNGIVPFCDRNVAIDSIRSIFLMIPHKGEIGNNYETVLSFFIDGVCKNIFSV